MKIGLFFGTFNPIHNGHLMIANYIINHTDIEKIVFVLSPHAPFKENNSKLANIHERSYMIEMAIQNIPCFSYTCIEENLSEPTYTYNTILYISQQKPQDEFSLILGSDNFFSINSWHEYEKILSLVRLLVVTRDTNELLCRIKVENLKQYVDNIKGIEVISGIPNSSLSSTFIRSEAKERKSLYYYTPINVAEYIQKSELYI